MRFNFVSLKQETYFINEFPILDISQNPTKSGIYSNVIR